MKSGEFGSKELPVGTRNGCLTIVAGFEEYEHLKEQKAAESILEYTRQIEEYNATGKIAPKASQDGCLSFSGFAMREDPVAELEEAIERAKNWRTDRFYRPCYKVQCKCGEILFVDHFHFTKKRHRFCDSVSDERKHCGPETCGLRYEQKEVQRRSAVRISTKHNSDSHTHIYLFSCHMQNTIRLLCIDCEP